MPKVSKALFVAPSFGGSGGEVHALECITRWSTQNSIKEIDAITTKHGASVLKSRGGKSVTAHIMPLIPKEQHHFFSKGLITSFLIKIIVSLYLVLKLVGKIQPDTIIVVSHFLHDLLPGLISAKLSKAKMVVYIHHLHPPISEREKYHPTMLSLFSSINDILSILLIRHFSDLVIGLSDIVTNQCKNHGIPKNKLAVTTNGVNMKYISKIPKATEAYDACFLGRLYPLKGIFDLVPIWKQVCSTLGDAKLVVVGVGGRKYEEMLRDDIRNHGLENNVVLKGYLPEEEKYAVIKSSRVFISPSYEEGWGITISEAMACALPVIAYDLPAYKVFKDVVIKVPIGERNIFADEMIKLLTDADRERKLGERSKIFGRQFDWQKVADKEVKILNQRFH